jgi:hypothetical protein
MKATSTKASARIVAASLILVASAMLARADAPVYSNPFDNSASVQNNGSANYNPPPVSTEFEFGSVVSHSIAWVTNDAQASPVSGSLKFNWTWNDTETNGASVDFRFDLFTFAGTVTNASALSFDIMVDPSSTPGALGDFGFINVITRDGSYVWNSIATFGEGLLAVAGGTTGVWAHVNIPLTDVNTNVRAITIQDYNDGSRQIVGSETFYLDNITIWGPGAVQSPTLAIARITGPRGLILLTTTNATIDSVNPQYERQGIQTVETSTTKTNSFSWVGDGNGGGFPVTYALTITNFPGSTFSNFQAHVFLVPYSTTLPTEANPDWAEANLIYLDIENQADGTTSAQLRFKINNPAANAPSFVTVTNPSALGTWSMTFSNDDVTVTAPGGNTAVTNLPLNASFFYFLDPMTVYVGVQPDLTNNIGQLAAFSNFQIVSNGITLLNDSFTSATLNPNVWGIAAEDPGGVLQIPPSAALALTWNLPDSGFRLTVNTNLSHASSWQTSLLPKSLYNGRRTVLVPASYLNTNEFYRLSNP